MVNESKVSQDNSELVDFGEEDLDDATNIIRKSLGEISKHSNQSLNEDGSSLSSFAPVENSHLSNDAYLITKAKTASKNSTVNGDDISQALILTVTSIRRSSARLNHSSKFEMNSI